VWLRPGPASFGLRNRDRKRSRVSLLLWLFWCGHFWSRSVVILGPRGCTARAGPVAGVGCAGKAGSAHGAGFADQLRRWSRRSRRSRLRRRGCAVVLTVLVYPARTTKNFTFFDTVRVTLGPVMAHLLLCIMRADAFRSSGPMSIPLARLPRSSSDVACVQ
jgi:hypothetical protein